MKTVTITIALFLISLMGISQNNLTVKINGLKTNSGTVMIQLFNEDQKIVQQTQASVTNKTSETTFKDLKPGNYAVQYYHDENGNGKMDTGMFSRPEEGYGFSNDARGFMGPADFEDQLFEIKSNLTITLKTVI